MMLCAEETSPIEGSFPTAQSMQACTLTAMAVVQRQSGVVQDWGDTKLTRYLTCKRNSEVTVTVVATDEQSEVHYHSQKKRMLEQNTIQDARKE